MDTQEALRIGEVAERTGLSEHMIRHYEARGLVKPVRSASGQRFYEADLTMEETNDDAHKTDHR